MGGMTARAAVATTLAPGGARSRVSTLRSQGHLVLRPRNPVEPEPLTHRRAGVARVALAAGTAGPVGGDDFHLDVRVGAGSTLVLSDVSSMLVLPGPHGDRSRMRVSVRVEEGATLVWIPRPVIAARRCRHTHDVRVSLEADARLVLREEVLLGRHREEPGDFTTTLRVTLDGRALYHQRLRFGPDADGSRGEAVLGGNRAAGSVIAVDPAWAGATPPPDAFAPGAALTALPGPGVLVTAVAPDNLPLRRLLDAGLDRLGDPWRP